ncbi:unnamed protein product [Rhodiola kirilowii]
MGKRRDPRRPTPDLNLRPNRPESSSSSRSPRRTSDSTLYQDRKLVIFVFLVAVLSPAISVIVYRLKFASPIVDGRRMPYVEHRRLVKTDINYKEILTENSNYSENTTDKHFPLPVLAYITPWNSRGYDLAKIFNSKFTHLSPVWYNLKSQGGSLILEGRHDADVGWISEIRSLGQAQLLPRIVLEAAPLEYLIEKEKNRAKVIDLIVEECMEMEYDGIVLESWSRWAAFGILHDPFIRSAALGFIEQLGEALHSITSRRTKKKLQLFYVIGPPHSDKLQEYDFGPNDLQSLSEAVDGFSLMTYDFSSPQNPGPNAPLNWIRSTLQLLLGSSNANARNSGHKVFLGINFYGNDFMLSGGLGGGAITSREYLHLLEQQKPALQWEKKSAEHFFIYSDINGVSHAVFYPSLKSLSVRLEEARLWGVGISIWEIGQGLDYFLDLL